MRAATTRENSLTVGRLEELKQPVSGSIWIIDVPNPFCVSECVTSNVGFCVCQCVSTQIMVCTLCIKVGWFDCIYHVTLEKYEPVLLRAMVDIFVKLSLGRTALHYSHMRAMKKVMPKYRVMEMGKSCLLRVVMQSGV